MSHVKLRRAESVLRDEISRLLLRGRLKDPRLQGRLTVADVRLARDMRHATVYISYIGDPQKEAETLEALQGSSGYVQGQIGKHVRLRYVPRITFEIDHSIERGINLVKKIEGLTE